jgi:hypothetical protein
MNEPQITTVAALGEAIEAQRAAKLASLQRKATTTSALVWIALGFLGIELVLIGAAYFVDRHVSPMAHFGVLLSSFSAVVAADAARRRQAAKDLEKELQSQN